MRDLTYDDFYELNIHCRNCGNWIDGSRYDQEDSGVRRRFRVCCQMDKGINSNWIAWESKESMEPWLKYRSLESELKFINKWFYKAC